jgi:hypothetical protein
LLKQVILLPNPETAFHVDEGRRLTVNEGDRVHGGAKLHPPDVGERRELQSALLHFLQGVAKDVFLLTERESEIEELNRRLSEREKALAAREEAMAWREQTVVEENRKAQEDDPASPAHSANVQHQTQKQDIDAAEKALESRVAEVVLRENLMAQREKALEERESASEGRVRHLEDREQALRLAEQRVAASAALAQEEVKRLRAEEKQQLEERLEQRAAALEARVSAALDARSQQTTLQQESKDSQTAGSPCGALNFVKAGLAAGGATGAAQAVGGVAGVKTLGLQQYKARAAGTSAGSAGLSQTINEKAQLAELRKLATAAQAREEEECGRLRRELAEAQRRLTEEAQSQAQLETRLREEGQRADQERTVRELQVAAAERQGEERLEAVHRFVSQVERLEEKVFLPMADPQHLMRKEGWPLTTQFRAARESGGQKCRPVGATQNARCTAQRQGGWFPRSAGAI